MNLKHSVTRLLLLSTLCLSLLRAPARAEYMDAQAQYLFSYYYSTAITPVFRSLSFPLYQQVGSINPYLGLSIYFQVEGGAKQGELILFQGYVAYYEAQAWLAFYASRASLQIYYEDLASQWDTYAKNEQTSWSNYYTGLSDYYISIYDYQLSIGTAY